MSFFYLPCLYLPALLVFTWLFRGEPCDYPWSRIRKVLFACLLFFGHAFISTARVLYADGGVVTISREEAEKLFAEQHPVPLELKRPGDERESEQSDTEAEAALNRLGAE